MSKPRRTVQKSASTGRLSRRDVTSVVRAIHVAPTDGSWVVQKAGPKRIRRTFASRDEAVSFARKLKTRNHVEIILHEPSGHVVRRAGL